jgi:hypothetical protein
MLRITVLTCALLATSANAARADEIASRLDIAKKQYEDKRLARSAYELQFALVLMQRKLSELYQATFPDPPEGWRAHPQDADRTGAFGTNIARVYQGPNANIRAQLMIDNPQIWASGHAALLNPLHAAQMGYTAVEIAGIAAGHALIKWHEAQKRVEAFIMVPGRLYLRLDGNGMASDQPVRDLMKAWNIQRVKDVADIP